MNVEGSLVNTMLDASRSKSRALYEKYKDHPDYENKIPDGAQLNAKYFGINTNLGKEGRELLYNKQLMDPRAAKAFAERRDLFYDDKHDYDGDGVADVVGASYDGTNYNTEMFNGMYVTKPGKSKMHLKIPYYKDYDRDARKDKTWTDVYLKSQNKLGTPKYQFDQYTKSYLKNAIQGTVLTLGDARKLLWNIVLEACFEGANERRTNLNRLLAKKAGKAVINKILTSVRENIENLAAQAAKTIRIYAVISSRGGDPDQYREYQTNENALKGLILNGEKQIEYNVWFPLSQKRSEKDEDYATNLDDRDAWIGTARQFLTNNGVNPDTFEQIQ